MNFKDEVVIITGAGSGIGKATALEFAAHGAIVVVSDINTEQGKATTDLINQQGGPSSFVKADVSSDQDVRHLVDSCIDKYGRLDHMINNAGIGLGLKFFDQISDEHWNKVIAVNQTGVFYCMRAALKVMQTNKKGSIVNVASAAGIRSAPRMGAYAASKHAVVGMTKTAAVEYGKYNIRINAVCPTVIETPMGSDYIDNNKELEQIMLRSVPMRRFGAAQEVAKTICWLSSTQASYLNGITVPVDGGSNA